MSEKQQNVQEKERECSSDGRAFVSHTKGKGIDTPHFHFEERKRKKEEKRDWKKYFYTKEREK